MTVPVNEQISTSLCAVCGAENLASAVACSACGTTLRSENPERTHVSALPRDMRLQDGQYVLSGVLGQGGFGITYRGTDAGLNRAVAIKEFFPTGCGRFGNTVLPA